MLRTHVFSFAGCACAFTFAFPYAPTRPNLRIRGAQRLLAETARDHVFAAGFGPGLTVEYARLSRHGVVGDGGAAAEVVRATDGATGPEGQGVARLRGRPLRPPWVARMRRRTSLPHRDDVGEAACTPDRNGRCCSLL